MKAFSKHPMRLSLLLLLTSGITCRAEQNVAGRWEGVIQIPGRELKLIVDLAQNNGIWIGSVIFPGLDIKGKPLTNIAFKDSDASFAMKSSAGSRGLEASFKGRLSSEGKLSGNFQQGGNTAPFVLEKTGAPQVELPEQSTPIAKELEGAWKGEYELNGYTRHVTLKLTNHGSAGATAQLVVVGKRVNNLPVDLVTQNNDSLGVDSHETGMRYEGRLGKERDEIKGTFIQGPIEVPLTLKRAN